MAPGHGGAYTALALPATAARQLLVPAALALALARCAPLPACSRAPALHHSCSPSSIRPMRFLWIPFGGFLAVRLAWRREGLRSGALALTALVVPAGLFLVWLVPVIRSTASVSPDAGERARAFDQYAGQLRGSVDHFSLAPQVFGRAGAVAVAALLLVPLTALASRRRWAAYVVGGSLAIFAITLVPWLFTPFSDVVSLSQARRARRVLPVRVRARRRHGRCSHHSSGPSSRPFALGAGIVCSGGIPVISGTRLEQGGPAWATWAAVGGATVALVFGLRRLRSVEATAALASALLLLPTFAHGLSEWSPSSERRQDR